MNKISADQLETVRLDTCQLMPGYDIRALDPIQALDKRVGNCFAKAIVACGIIAVRHDLNPSVIYSDRLHGATREDTIRFIKRPKPQDDVTHRTMAHITVLVPEAGKTKHDILGLDFGIDAVTDQGDILDYNETEEYVYYNQPKKRISVTYVALGHGLRISNWREGASTYLRKLDRQPLNPDRLLSCLGEMGIQSDQVSES